MRNLSRSALGLAAWAGPVLGCGQPLGFGPAKRSLPPAYLTIRSVIGRALDSAEVPDAEREMLQGETLGRAGFDDFETETASLSGGWRKRLSIAQALVPKLDILLLDEPTNHLDLAGIEWLEKLLQNGVFACVLVSHDRYFLENVATRMMELHRVYAG